MLKTRHFRRDNPRVRDNPIHEHRVFYQGFAIRAGRYQQFAGVHFHYVDEKVMTIRGGLSEREREREKGVDDRRTTGKSALTGLVHSSFRRKVKSRSWPAGI